MSVCTADHADCFSSTSSSLHAKEDTSPRRPVLEKAILRTIFLLVRPHPRPRACRSRGFLVTAPVIQIPFPFSGTRRVCLPSVKPFRHTVLFSGQRAGHGQFLWMLSLPPSGSEVDGPYTRESGSGPPPRCPPRVPPAVLPGTWPCYREDASRSRTGSAASWRRPSAFCRSSQMKSLSGRCHVEA